LADFSKGEEHMLDNHPYLKGDPIKVEGTDNMTMMDKLNKLSAGYKYKEY
jgi:hypothetical protein